MSSKFDQTRPWSAELAALERLKNLLLTLELFKIFLLHAGSQVIDRCPLGYLLKKKKCLLNLQIMLC